MGVAAAGKGKHAPSGPIHDKDFDRILPAVAPGAEPKAKRMRASEQHPDPDPRLAAGMVRFFPSVSSWPYDWREDRKPSGIDLGGDPRPVEVDLIRISKAVIML